MSSAALKAPFPWFGGKSKAAGLIWPRFGNVNNYVEPFAGSLAVLLGRPSPPNIETVNDKDCYIANFWRAMQADPEALAAAADWPVNEADLHARHQWLVDRGGFRHLMRTDPDFYDVKVAGWWVWGICSWIGGGWCHLGRNTWLKRPDLKANGGKGLTSKTWKQRPHLKPQGAQGINAVTNKRPRLCGSRTGSGVLAKCVKKQMPAVNGNGTRGVAQDLNIQEWFMQLAHRLRDVRVCCGDWTRIMGSTPLGLTTAASAIFKTAVLLDPPYSSKVRNPDIYAEEDGDVAEAVRKWAIENGDNPKLRIALCGYEGEHAMPPEWECVRWKANGGYARADSQNSRKERIWFSPHCLKQEEQFAFDEP